MSMNLDRLRQTQNKFAVLGLVAFALTFQFWVIDSLPIFKWDLPNDLKVYIIRTISVGASLLFIWAVAPRALSRFRVRINFFKITFFVVVCAAMVAITIIRDGVTDVSILGWLNALLFSLFIGLDEETFDRGLIFGIIERFGQESALVISSVIFGASHITNFFYGEDSFNYSLGHMLDAASFGYVMGALMLVSKSIWLPILAHGMIDLAWVVMDPKTSLQITSGNTNWPMTILYFSLNIIAARLLLRMQSKWEHFPNSFKGLAKQMGLIE